MILQLLILALLFFGLATWFFVKRKKKCSALLLVPLVLWHYFYSLSYAIYTHIQCRFSGFIEVVSGLRRKCFQKELF